MTPKMDTQFTSFPLTERQAEFIKLAQGLVVRFSTRAAEYDRTGNFPFANIADVRRMQLPRLVVPKDLGGWGANLLETVLCVETLAQGDGSTALAVTMHFQTLGHVAETHSWPDEIFARLCQEAVERGALVNYIATEPQLGSPSRGGKPATTAQPVPADDPRGPGWLLNGRKNFASLSPALDYLIVLATCADESEQVAHFVATPGPGLEIMETWDSLGMRATGSHDVLLHDVFVPADLMIPAPVKDPDQKPAPNAWFPLTISAVYLGVAAAALTCAARYAHDRVPTALGKPIATLETIQHRLGQAELLLHQARTQLHTTADLWDRYPDRRAELGPALMVTKVTATNHAVAIVDHCMRAVGGASMSKTLPLERYYRDVRGGLSHPIHDDRAYILLGQQALTRHGPP